MGLIKPRKSGGGFPNGTKWEFANIPTQAMYGVSYTNGLYFAGSYDDKGLYYSKDGITWNQTSITNKSITMVLYANGIYVAGACFGGLLYSEDGINWTQSNVTNQTWSNLFYYNGKFLACWSGSLRHSTDGKTWSDEVSIKTFNEIEYLNGKFIMASTFGIFYSNDGINWSSTNVTKSVYSIHYADGLYLATGEAIWLSYDGVIWEETNPIDRGYSYITPVYKAQNKWIVSIYEKGVFYSYDGRTWTQCTLSDGNNTADFAHILYACGVWVACAGGRIYNSLDGITWNYVSEAWVGQIKHLNGVWYIADRYDGLLYSPTWRP